MKAIKKSGCVNRTARKSSTRRMMYGSLWILIGFLFTFTARSEESRLRILTWPGYADEDVVRDFSRLYNAKVSVTYVTSDDDLWSRLSAEHGSNFDVFAANTAELQRYLAKDQVMPIDLSLVPNQKLQLPRFRVLLDAGPLVSGGKPFAIPFTYSEMGLIYNKDIVSPPPTSINALWDTAYRGKVLAFDASNHNFSIAAQALGFPNPFQMSNDELLKAAVKLIELRRNILTLYSDPDEALKLYKEGNIALIYANYGAQQVNKMKSAGLNIGYVVPVEGAFAWLDCWAISRGAKDKELAHAWLNYMLTPSVSHLLTERQGLANTLTKPELQQDTDKMVWLETLEDPEKRISLWERIRAGDAPETFR
ncbi:MAG: extracellular solute-binding protein [Hahellaceae bacterium]|nr:extracellular solute-binding protein [Hahellaceae bacterium]